MPLRPVVFFLTPLLATALLGACASGPPPAAPTPQAALAQGPADARWNAVLPAGPVLLPANDPSAWWAGFDDPQLPLLVQAAVAASPTLAAAQARLERARAAQVAAGAALLPSLDGSASLSSGRSAPRQPTSTSANLGVQAGWELDFFGANRAGAAAATARTAASVADLHATRTAVAAETATALVSLRACQAQAQQSRFDAESRTTTANLTEQTAKAGFAAPADAALARASAASARNTARAQDAQCEGLIKALVELSAVPEATLRSQLAPRSALVPQAPAFGLAELPAAVLSQRPDVAQAAYQLQAAASDQTQAAAREWPQVALAGSFGAASVRSAGSTLSGSTWSLGPLSINLPLFDAGARRANTTAARASYDEAVAQYQGTVRRAVREVEVALVNLAAAGERQADAEAAARDFEASLRATEARWRGGLASQFELEDARRSASQALQVLIDLRRERSTAWITLYRVLGGGWRDDQRDPRNTAPAKAAA